MRRKMKEIILQECGDIITNDCFKATTTGLIVGGEPTFEAWEEYGQKLHFVEGALQWLIGDWLNYGDRKYGELYSQALDAETSPQIWMNYKWVAGHVETSLRNEVLSWTHHLEVAKLPPEQQKKYLDLAFANHLTSRELHTRIILDTKLLPPPPEGKYDVIYADPPWRYENSGFDQSAEQHYPTMPLDEIKSLPIADLVANPCVLFLWATSPLLPEALEVMDAWGFEYRASRVWIKDKAPTIGWWIKTRHELLLIGTHGGNAHPLEKVDSIISAKATIHSRKPESVKRDIEKCYPGPKIELFARVAPAQQDNDGTWTYWGNERLDEI